MCAQGISAREISGNSARQHGENSQMELNNQ